MSGSLKLFAPGMARLLGMTPAALYNRQRELVRAGLLEHEGHRGPGSGVRTTAGAVATLLIAALAEDGLSDVAGQTSRIIEAKTAADTGKIWLHRKLGDALIELLTSEAKSKKIVDLTISKNSSLAVVRYREGRATMSQTFVDETGDTPAIRKDATISGSIIASLSTDVRAIIEAGVAAEEAPTK